LKMNEPLKITVLLNSLKSLVISILGVLGILKKDQEPNQETLEELKLWQEKINNKLHAQTHFNEIMIGEIDIIKEYSGITLQGMKCILDYLDRNTEEKEIVKAKCRIDKFLFKIFKNKKICDPVCVPELCENCPERIRE